MTVVTVQTSRPALARGQRFWLAFLRLLALLPWLWVAGVGALLGAYGLQNGVLPGPDSSGPAMLDPWGVLLTPVLILLILSVAAPLLIFLFALLARRSVPGSRLRSTLKFFLFGESLFLLILVGAIVNQLLTGRPANSWVLAVVGVPLAGVVALAAWPDILTYRWTRWMAAGVVWGFAFGGLSSAAPQIMNWLVN